MMTKKTKFKLGKIKRHSSKTMKATIKLKHEYAQSVHDSSISNGTNSIDLIMLVLQITVKYERRIEYQ